MSTYATKRALGKLDLTQARNWRAAVARLEGAYSEHTLRSYRADFSRFEAWCETAGHVALPATPETVATFIADEAPTHAPATLKRRLAGIRKLGPVLNWGIPARLDV